MFYPIHACVTVYIFIKFGVSRRRRRIYSVCIVLDTLNTYQPPHKCSSAKKRKRKQLHLLKRKVSLNEFVVL